MKRRRLPKSCRNGRNDCLRRAVAYVTGLKRVPHFVGHYPRHWSHYLRLWLERRGFMLIDIRRGRGGYTILPGAVRKWIVIGTDRWGGCHATVMEAATDDAPAVPYQKQHPLRSVSQTLIILRRRAA